jgi:hypothetical protein
MSATAFTRVRREQEARRQEQLRREAEQLAAAQSVSEPEADDEPAPTHKRPVGRPPKVREDDGTDRRD